MPQPTVFRSIPKSDVQVTRFNAHKNWSITNTTATASGYFPLNAIFYDMRSNMRGDTIVQPREPGTPGTEYGDTKALYQIKPQDYTVALSNTGFIFDPNGTVVHLYGLVPHSKPGTSITNIQTNTLTGADDGLYQVLGKAGVPGINGNLDSVTRYEMPPTASSLHYFKFAIWESLHHMYYARPYDPFGSLQSNQTDPNKMHKFLHYSASMVSIPYSRQGHEIKPESLEISSTRFPFTLTDDKYGNIVIPSSSLDTGSFAPNDNLVAHWGFNEIYKQSRYGYHVGKFNDWNTSVDVKLSSGQFSPVFNSHASLVAFTPGINTTGVIEHSGFGADFGTQQTNNTLSYIKTTNFVGINPDNDFAWSTWFRAGTNQNTSTDINRDIISKYGVEKQYIKKYTGITLNQFLQMFPGNPGRAQHEFDKAQKDAKNFTYELQEQHVTRNRYPYRIGMYDQTHASAGHIYVRRSNGTFTVDFSSSADLRNAYNHIVVQKTGSLIELWVNGTLDNSGSDVGGNCNNNSLLMFGASNKSGSNPYSGSVDEIRYYDTSLTSAQIQSLGNNHYLSGSAYQTNVVGNVFRSFGYVVCSSPLWFYNDLFTPTYDWTLKHKSSLEITEYNILANIPKGHFNVSQNPSAIQGTNSDLLLNEFTASLTPYVSTIGLYDDAGCLLAVGKLSNAIQKRNDVDMNFVIRWDM